MAAWRGMGGGGGRKNGQRFAAQQMAGVIGEGEIERGNFFPPPSLPLPFPDYAAHAGYTVNDPRRSQVNQALRFVFTRVLTFVTNI